VVTWLADEKIVLRATLLFWTYARLTTTTRSTMTRLHNKSHSDQDQTYKPFLGSSGRSSQESGGIARNRLGCNFADQ